MAGILEMALAYPRAERGVISIRLDGSKAPVFSRGHLYFHRRPTEENLRRWFATGCCGLAIVCGEAT